MGQGKDKAEEVERVGECGREKRESVREKG